MASKNDVSYLISQLDTQGDIQAEKIIQKIARIGATSIPLLKEAAQNEEHPRIMKWSLLALGTIGDKKCSPILIKALSHERMSVKLQAMGGLARMNHKASAKKIALLLTDESGGVRGRALKTLIALNNKSIVNSILPTLNDPMWYVRQEACKACEHFKIQSSIPILVELKKSDEKKAVKSAAINALKAMKHI
jgi:HEAT repeat protein